ncbi:galactose oxidase [Lactarius quietus]|nr:galactose oxidase [Lactarius quietus]
MHSVSDLTTFSRKTSGEVPPKLVGASTTVVGDKVYLYGGRLVTERRMVTDMYVFDLKTLVWEKIVAPTDDSTPAQRYFHSADSWNQYLIIFGGMGLKPEADEGAEDLCVLNDVCFYDIPAKRWMPPSWSLKENPLISLPKPRYAHLSSVSGDRLFIIGGQDLDSVWLDDVYIYDLPARTWVLRRDYPRHCGTYRSVAVSADLRVHLPQEVSRNHSPTHGKPLFRTSQQTLAPTSHTPPRDTHIHLPYSAQSTDDFPNEIYLYSNYNFTDVKRELEILTPSPDGEFSVRDASSNMNGPAFPPGLRFPAGAILGTHLIIAGTYLAHSFQSFSVWALNLIDMSWTRIDPGSTLTTGSWFRSGLWAKANKFIVFGNRQGSLVDDYNRRLLSWDHIAMIDLEAFGIYQPPRLELDIRMQEMGLAALEEGILADFEIVCDDDRRVKCSRKLLEDRWPWFKEQRRLFLQGAAKALETLPLSATHVALPDVPNTTQEPRLDPRLTPRQLSLSEPYPITLALVQYFYSLALVTPLQHAPAVLSALLVLATNYDLGHLQSLVKHAMHRALSNSTSVGVYEVATLCSCRSLQIRYVSNRWRYGGSNPSTSRALKTVMVF